MARTLVATAALAVMLTSIGALTKPATALEIIQTTDVSATSAAISTFDPNLGTLNSVTESFTGSLTVASPSGTCTPDVIQIAGSPPEVEPGASCTFKLELEVKSSFGPDFSGSNTSSVDPVVVGANDIPGVTVDVTGSQVLSPAGFIGSPNPHIKIVLDETFEKLETVGFSSDLATTSPDTLSSMPSGTWELVYDFTPTANVPEPGSLIIFVSSLGMLFPLIRRYRS